MLDAFFDGVRTKKHKEMQKQFLDAQRQYADAERVKKLEALLREAADELNHAAFVAYLPEDVETMRKLRDRILAELNGWEWK